MQASLKERLGTDLLEATRKRDRLRTWVIRMARDAIAYAEIAKGAPVDEASVVEILSREVKQRRESIAEFKKGRRQDLVEKEEAELAILLGYLPQQLSREEVTAEAARVIAEVGARGPGEKGKVMGRLMPQLKGRADGKMVSEVVSELLAGPQP